MIRFILYKMQIHSVFAFQILIDKITSLLLLQKNKDAQRSCAIAVDIAGALSK